MTKVRQLQVTIDLELMLVDSEFDTENLGAILAVLAKEYLEDFSCLGEATKKAVVASPKSLEAADNTEDVMEVEAVDNSEDEMEVEAEAEAVDTVDMVNMLDMVDMVEVEVDTLMDSKSSPFGLILLDFCHLLTHL